MLSLKHMTNFDRYGCVESDNNNFENMSLLSTSIKDNFIETSIISSDDNKINHLKIS